MNYHLQKMLFILLLLVTGVTSPAQTRIWSLDDCIEYALERNVTVLKSKLSIKSAEQNYQQAKNNRLPSLQASINHTANWNKQQNTIENTYGNLIGVNNTTYGFSADAILFNGFKLKMQIKQQELNLQSSGFYSEVVAESTELSILDAYVQILYAEEEVKNANRQLESTSQQLVLAQERKDLGVISKVDYLQIKSELASEKLTLANAESNLAMTRVTLMQLMEMPVNDAFQIESPDLESLISRQVATEVFPIYQHALTIMPQIMQSELNLASASLDEKIAKAERWPTLSLGAGISSGWNNQTLSTSYFNQLNNEFNPYIGLSLYIPVFQKYTVRSAVKLARINVLTSQLDAQETKNNLRKQIEQASVDVLTAQSQYSASSGKYEAAIESYKVATEKFATGMLSSADYLIEKNNQITAENDLLQAKFTLLFSYKTLDYYKGIPVSLSK